MKIFQNYTLNILIHTIHIANVLFSRIFYPMLRRSCRYPRMSTPTHKPDNCLTFQRVSFMLLCRKLYTYKRLFVECTTRPQRRNVITGVVCARGCCPEQCDHACTVSRQTRGGHCRRGNLENIAAFRPCFCA